MAGTSALYDKTSADDNGWAVRELSFDRNRFFASVEGSGHDGRRTLVIGGCRTFVSLRCIFDLAWDD